MLLVQLQCCMLCCVCCIVQLLASVCQPAFLCPHHFCFQCCNCRRDVEEKSEQLKAISTLAALIAGFALTAFLQFNWDPSFADRSGALLPLFGVTMALAVSVPAPRASPSRTAFARQAARVWYCGPEPITTSHINLQEVLAGTSISSCDMVDVDIVVFAIMCGDVAVHKGIEAQCCYEHEKCQDTLHYAHVNITRVNCLNPVCTAALADSCQTLLVCWKQRFVVVHLPSALGWVVTSCVLAAHECCYLNDGAVGGAGDDMRHHLLLDAGQHFQNRPELCVRRRGVRVHAEVQGVCGQLPVSAASDLLRVGALMSVHNLLAHSTCITAVLSAHQPVLATEGS